MLNPPDNGIDIHELSPLALAFVGDGVLELLVRAKLVSSFRLSPGALHREAVEMVSARAQALALEDLAPQLTEREAALVRRGRNASKATVSKNASAREYRLSTGLEALFGWLYLQNELARVEELFEVIWNHYLAHNQSG